MEAILYEIWLLFFLILVITERVLSMGITKPNNKRYGCFIDLIQADFSFTSRILNVFKFPIPRLAGHKVLKLTTRNIMYKT